jgi:hypothetical protein
MNIRRDVLKLAGGMLSVGVSPFSTIGNSDGTVSFITESDLGQAVRRSVVRGAQFMDSLDSRWEKISDEMSLGEERSRRDKRPTTRVFAEQMPLDASLAKHLLEMSDRAVAKILSLDIADLTRRFESVSRAVQPIYERTGLDVAGLLETNTPTTVDEFDFLAYCHYKAYVDLFLQQHTVSFPVFQREMERNIGCMMLKEMLPSYQPLEYGTRCAQWKHSVESVERLNVILISRGLLRSSNRILVEPEAVADWC